MLFRCAVCWLILAAWPLFAQLPSTTLEFTDGGKVSGRLVAFKDQHIQMALEGGGETPVYTNVLWARLSQKTLRELADNRQAAAFANIFIDPPAESVSSSATRKLNIVTPP